MDECPLCLEELDATDKATLYCQCEYQICAFCWQQLHDNASKDNTMAKCPNCRTPYDKDNIRMLEIDQEELERMKNRKHDRKTKAGTPLGAGGAKSKRDLANIRVLQKNLVYAVGLAAEICDEELLKGSQYFGQFGKIIKISVNRPTPSAVGIKTNSGSAYITYKRTQDAERCIKSVDDVVWMGRHVRVCYGTTKYCNAFLKGLPCNNQDCLYLHDIGMCKAHKEERTCPSPPSSTAEEEISFTKEEMANIGPAKFAGHTGVLPTGGSLRRVHPTDDAPDTPSPHAGTPHQHQQPPDMSMPIAVPRTGSRPDSLWDGGMLGQPASPNAAARAGSWASTLLGAPGQPPAVDSTADFPELSAPPDNARTPPPPANGATMAEQLARAAAGPGTPLTAASRLKARKEESVRKMQPISPAAKGGRASRLGASASSLSELEGSRPGSGQHDGSEGDANQGEDAQHLAATMTWQVIDGDAAALERDVAALGGKGGKRAPPPGFEHLGPTSHPLADEGGDMRQARMLLQCSLEAILASPEVPLPTYGRLATQSRFGFARRNGEAHMPAAQMGQMGMQLLRQLQGVQGGGFSGLYGAPAAQTWK